MQRTAYHLRQERSLKYDTLSWTLALRIFRFGDRPSFHLIPLSLITAECLLISYFSVNYGMIDPLPSEVPLAIGGMTSLLLAFRLSASYSRYWEARNLWGLLINGTRSLMLRVIAASLSRVQQIGSIDPPEQEGGPTVLNYRRDARTIAGWCLCFAISLKHHLRNEPFEARSHLKQPPRHSAAARAGSETDGTSDGLSAAPLWGLLPEANIKQIQIAAHPPLRALLGLRTALAVWAREKSVAFELALINIDENLLGALTGCERILRTPVPAGYVGVLRAVIVFWLALLPFTLVNDIGWYTAIVIVAVGHVVLSVEHIATEIENPFGHDTNDLPLELFCATIEAECLLLLDELH